MASEREFRKLLINITNAMGKETKDTFVFLIGDDIPRCYRARVAAGTEVSMNIIWEELIKQQKITSDNVDYLIDRFKDIGRMNLVRQLKKYSSTESESPVIKAKHRSD